MTAAPSDLDAGALLVFAVTLVWLFTRAVTSSVGAALDERRWRRKLQAVGSLPIPESTRQLARKIYSSLLYGPRECQCRACELERARVEARRFNFDLAGFKAELHGHVRLIERMGVGAAEATAALHGFNAAMPKFKEILRGEDR